MAKIFVSHSSSDHEFVIKLADDLRLLGHFPWTDDLLVHPGEPIAVRVQRGLSECAHMIVVLSPAAVQSRWVEHEWTTQVYQAVEGRAMRIVPVLKEACEIPESLRPRCRADFTRSYGVGFCHLVGALEPHRINRDYFAELLPLDFVHAIEHAARTSSEDHIRIACAHAIWSCRPDRARPILEDACHDLRDFVRDHARMLLEQY